MPLPTMARCRDCGATALPPKWRCHRCGGRALEEVAVPGDGRVFSFTHMVDRAGGDRWVALVDTGGVRVLAPLDGPLAVGDPVRLYDAPGETAGFRAAAGA
jgi:uncharacterized OB-fold protein